MNDHAEFIAEINGLKAQVAELRREVGLLQRDNIDLREENRSLRRLLTAFKLPEQRPC